MVLVHQKRKTISEKNLIRMGVPKRFISSTIMDFNTYGDERLGEVKVFIKNYIKELDKNIQEGKGIMLFGSNGVGKSMLASIILKESYIKRYVGKRCTYTEYLSEYARLWTAKSDEEKIVMEDAFIYYFKGADILVLEELGKELDTKISIPALEDLLRYREEHGLCTIICTNLSPSNIQEVYGASIFSLLKGNLTPIKIVGTDHREEVYNSEK